MVPVAPVHGDADDAADEFRQLVHSSGAAVVDEVGANRNRPDPRLFIGRGKADEVRACAEANQADLVVVDHDLSPGQERNLEAEFRCRVLDRTGLILDIFAQRARSFTGKLQVELAQLNHLASRLVRGWTHLERQRGGIGLRGPGETQLEMDRRLINGRIRQIRKRLVRVHRQREQSRRTRRAAETPQIALVGYTNAGKSTLFRRLAEPEATVGGHLFATLDPTLRRLPLPFGHPAVLADTVGFIRDLPHELVEAFRSTLEETRDADLLLHVIDGSDPARDDRVDDVESVLSNIGAGAVPRLEIYNKSDRTQGRKGIERDATGRPARVRISAATGDGVDELLTAVAECLSGHRVHGWLRAGSMQGRLRARLYDEGAVIAEHMEPSGWLVLEVVIDATDWQRIAAGEAVDPNMLHAPVTPVAGEASAP